MNAVKIWCINFPGGQLKPSSTEAVYIRPHVQLWWIYYHLNISDLSHILSLVLVPLSLLIPTLTNIFSVFSKSPSSRHAEGTRDTDRSRSNRDREGSRDRSAVDWRSSDRHRVERRRTPDRRRERDRTPDRHRPMSPDRNRFVLLLSSRCWVLTRSFPHFFWLAKWVYQSIHGHTGLTHHFYFFDIWALWRSGLSYTVPKCQKIKSGGLNQYGPERFEV